MDGAAFMRTLADRVRADARRHRPGVRGGWAFTQPLSLRGRVRDALDIASARSGMRRTRPPAADVDAALSRARTRADGLARTHGLLSDAESRDLLLTVLSLRALGPRRVALPVEEPAFRRACASIERDLRVARAVATSPDGTPLDRFEVPGSEGPISLTAVAFLVHEFFGLEQYALRRAGATIAAAPGDVVVDGGGGWGETALYFADAVGGAGRVLCFEFVPETLRLLETNLAANPHLHARVEVVEHPLWHEAGEQMAYTADGGQSVLLDRDREEHDGAEDGRLATTETIDHLCASRGIDRIDLIKLDVEGSELNALRGAVRRIGADRPKLAVSIYHSDEDLVEIPAWIDGLGLGYELYLSHLWPGAAETILFAHVPAHRTGAGP